MIYEYECPGDGNVIEIKRGINDSEPEYDCPVCGTTLVRIYRPAPIIFNAPGFYSRDNRKN